MAVGVRHYSCILRTEEDLWVNVSDADPVHISTEIGECAIYAYQRRANATSNTPAQIPFVDSNVDDQANVDRVAEPTILIGNISKIVYRVSRQVSNT